MRILFILLFSILISCKTIKSSTSENLGPNQIDSLFQTSNENQFGSQMGDSLTNKLIEIQKQEKIFGFSVALVDENGLIYENGFGFSDYKNGIKYTPQTIQPIGSISKILIGISLLMAQEWGLLDLDDPVNRYLPFEGTNPFYPDIPITIRHLATHTSGINDVEYQSKNYILQNIADTSRTELPFQPPNTNMSIQDFTRKSLDKNGEWYSEASFLQKKPGEFYKYSGVASTLAAVIIELVTEMPYSTFTTEYILNPLEMSSAGWFFEDVNLDQYSELYTSSGKPFPMYNYINYPTGRLIVSVNDLGKLLSELIKGYSGKGILLRKASYEELFGEAPENFYDGSGNSAFIKMDLTKGIFMGRTEHGFFGHTGAAPGVIAFMFFNMDSNIGRILILNTRIEPEDIQVIWNIWDLLDKYEEILAG